MSLARQGSALRLGYDWRPSGIEERRGRHQLRAARDRGQDRLLWPRDERQDHQRPDRPRAAARRPARQPPHSEHGRGAHALLRLRADREGRDRRLQRQVQALQRARPGLLPADPPGGAARGRRRGVRGGLRPGSRPGQHRLADRPRGEPAGPRPRPGLDPAGGSAEQARPPPGPLDRGADHGPESLRRPGGGVRRRARRGRDGDPGRRDRHRLGPHSGQPGGPQDRRGPDRHRSAGARRRRDRDPAPPQGDPEGPARGRAERRRCQEARRGRVRGRRRLPAPERRARREVPPGQGAAGEGPARPARPAAGHRRAGPAPGPDPRRAVSAQGHAGLPGDADHRSHRPVGSSSTCCSSRPRGVAAPAA